MIFGGQDRGQIGADAEIGRLAERGEAGKAEQNVDAHRQDGEASARVASSTTNELECGMIKASASQRGGDDEDFDLLAYHRSSLTRGRTGRSA